MSEGTRRMRPRGDAYIRCTDGQVQSCKVLPRGARRGSSPTWAVMLDDNGTQPDGVLVHLAQYQVEVIGVFEFGECTVARLTVNADYGLPRTRMIATGVAPGVKWYRLSGKVTLATEVLVGEGGETLFGVADARFFLNATDLCGAQQWRAAGVLDT